MLPLDKHFNNIVLVLRQSEINTMVLKFFEPTEEQRSEFRKECFSEGSLLLKHAKKLTTATKDDSSRQKNKRITRKKLNKRVRTYAGDNDENENYHVSKKPEKVLRIWTDGSFCPDMPRKIGLGVYISAEKSYSRCEQIEPTNSGALAAEARAVYYALKKARSLRKAGKIRENRIIIHCDCQSVINAMNKNNIPNVTFNGIFKKIRHFADKNFESVEYTWVKGHKDPGNIEADKLAGKALKR